MYNLFSGAQSLLFVQFILGGARKKVFVHKKMQSINLFWWRVRLGCPVGEVNFLLNIFVKAGRRRYHIL